MIENMSRYGTPIYFAEDEKGQVTVYFKMTMRSNDMNVRNLVCNVFDYVTTCPNLESLFLELMYDGVPDMEVSERVKSRVLEFANRLYVEDVKQFKDIPIQERYAQLKQMMLFPEYTAISQRVTTYGDEGLNELLESKRDDKKSAEDLYCEVLEEKKQGRYVNAASAKRAIAFPSAEDVLAWAFDQIVNSGKELRLCANCGQFFLFSGERLKYCSERCGRQGNVDSYFLGNNALKTSHNRVAATFDRRIKSDAIYTYEVEGDEAVYVEGVFSEDLPEEQQWENRYETSYNKSDFKIMKATFLNCRKEKFEKIRNHRKTCGNDETAIEEDAKQVRELIAWTEAVDQCLKNFKRE